MTRQEFEDKLPALTPTELYNLSNPYVNIKKYDKLFNELNNDFTAFMSLIKNRAFFKDCNIFPEYSKSSFKSPNTAFSRQDRFIHIPPHSHGYIEMSYVFSGNCTALINDKNISLSTGDLVILEANAVHAFLPLKDNDIVLNILLSTEYFTSSFLDTLLNGGPISRFLADVMIEKNNHYQYLLFHTSGSSLAKELIENMIIEYLNPGICSEAIMLHSFNLLFIELSRCYQEQMIHINQYKSIQFLPCILDYMERHCTECNLTQVSRQFGYHPNYISRILKQETGSNFQDILSEYRLKRVAFLLSNSTIPIYKIANECGYQNQSFFRQKFQEFFKKSPREYRRDNKK